MGRAAFSVLLQCTAFENNFDFILFCNSKNRHLEFLNLSPQGLISSTHNAESTKIGHTFRKLLLKIGKLEQSKKCQQ